MGHFTKQVIVCLASNLESVAQEIAKKHYEGRTTALMTRGTWTGGMPGKKLSASGAEFALAGNESRLVIVAHADPKSRGVNEDPDLTGKKLAEYVTGLLDGPIGRITLHMCHGGGFRKDGKIQWSNSIAFDFASHAGHLTRQVTARTDEVGGNFGMTGGKSSKPYFHRTVGPLEAGRGTGGKGGERLPDDKIVFNVKAGSNLNHPEKPEAFFCFTAPPPA